MLKDMRIFSALVRSLWTGSFFMIQGERNVVKSISDHCKSTVQNYVNYYKPPGKYQTVWREFHFKNGSTNFTPNMPDLF